MGAAYLFCYTRLALAPLAAFLEGLTPLLTGEQVAPQPIEAKLTRQFRLLGTEGLAGMALAAVDMAAWDALARSASLPLWQLLGASRRGTRAYLSAGMGGPQTAAEDAEEAIGRGFTGIKLKVGYPTIEEDIEAVRAARQGGLAVMVDYNQSLNAAEDIRRARRLEAEGVAWMEEPVDARDTTSQAEVARSVDLPIQLGESWWGHPAMVQAVAGRCSDLAMPDAMKIGGVSGWRRAAALAEAYRLPLSSHLFPELSAHLLAATPTADWLEYTDWVEPLLREPVRIESGTAIPGDAPGSGVAWDEAARERFRVSD